MLTYSLLTSNGMQIPFTEDYFVPMKETGPSTQGGLSEVIDTFHNDGFVLVRGLLDPELLIDLRTQYFSTLPSQMLRPGTPPGAGIFSGQLPAECEKYGVEHHPAHTFARDKSFNILCENRQLRTLASLLLGGGDVVALARRIVRHFWRDSGRASRAHRDRDYMTHGSDNVITAWVSLGDCTTDMGSLVYLDQSADLTAEERDGLRQRSDRPHDHRPLTHDLKWATDLTGRRWRWADFRTGDVAFHSPYVVHASLDSASDVMRLSADIRLQRASTTIDERWSQRWSADDGA